jgi:hypothetical protein
MDQGAYEGTKMSQMKMNVMRVILKHGFLTEKLKLKFSRNPLLALQVAMITQKPFPEGEAAIAQDRAISGSYYLYVLNTFDLDPVDISKRGEWVLRMNKWRRQHGWNGVM